MKPLFEKYGTVKIYEFPYKRYQSQKKAPFYKIKEYLFLIKCQKSVTNESLGISVEQNLCLLNKINYPQCFNDRSLKFYHSELKIILRQFLKDHPEIRFQKYIGSKQNMADFQLTKGSTLSVKSNKSQSKVCPARIGQLTKKRFCEEFHLPKNMDDFQMKSYIRKNIFKFTFKYYQNLFVCDYILWIDKRKGEWNSLLIDRKKAFPYPFNIKEEFSFTRDPNNWKESTTIKYKKVSVWPKAQRRISDSSEKRLSKISFSFSKCMKIFRDSTLNQRLAKVLKSV